MFLKRKTIYNRYIKKIKNSYVYQAQFYQKNKDNIQCTLCPKKCVILENKSGFCGVRKNIKKEFYALNYGKPVAMNIDPIEKKPLYHFYPGSPIFSLGTFGCNLSCQFCQNHEISQFSRNNNLFEQDNDNIDFFSPSKIIELCKKQNLKFLAFTYNEPTVFYEYMLDIAKLCQKNDIKTVMVSNGQINPDPLKKLINYIDAFNIDLKAFNKNFYQKICQGDYPSTKKTIEIIVAENKHLEVTFLLIEGYNDNEVEFKEMCKFLKNLNSKIVLHISRSFPNYKLDFQPTPKNLLENFKSIANQFLKHVYLGNI